LIAQSAGACRFKSVAGALKDSFQMLGTVVVVAQAWPQQDVVDAAHQDLKQLVAELKSAGPAGQQQLQVRCCLRLSPACPQVLRALPSGQLAGRHAWPRMPLHLLD
jgi:hypothetical protein